MTTSPDSIIWITEARLHELCRIKRATWRSWAEGGLVAEDPGGAYSEEDVLEAAMIAALRERLSFQDVKVGWKALRRSGASSELIARARALSNYDRFDLVVEPETRIITLAMDDAELARAVRHPEDPRTVLVVPVAERLRRVRDGFRVIAAGGERPATRKVGRPARSAVVTHLRGDGSG